jgi:peroxiredoxin
MANVGEKLKDFILKDQDNNDINSQDLRGKRILLSFHPLAWTGVCANQMKSLQDNLEALTSLNTVPLGISIDHVPCKAAWAKELKVDKVRLLADFWPHGEVAKSLGIFREKQGFSERANIIVDEEGKLIFVKIYDIPELPDLNEIIDFLNKA